MSAMLQPILPQGYVRPELKKKVYSKYREMLGSYNDQANTIIQSVPSYKLVEDKGFNIDQIENGSMFAT